MQLFGSFARRGKTRPEVRLTYSALRQCGARPGELCRATIADVDRAAAVITLKEHKTARKTGKPRRIPIGRKLGELLTQAIGDRQAGPIFLSPSETWGRKLLLGDHDRLGSMLEPSAWAWRCGRRIFGKCNWRPQRRQTVRRASHDDAPVDQLGHSRFSTEAKKASESMWRISMNSVPKIQPQGGTSE
jgi:integrase